MFELLVIWSSIGWSLYLISIRRSAIWLLPGLFIGDYFAIAGAAILSFFVALAIQTRYEKESFDFRSFSKERWSLALLLAGILTGSVFYPANISIFAVGAILPVFLFQLYKVFRMPVSQVYCIPQAVQFLLIINWIIIFAIRFRHW